MAVVSTATAKYTGGSGTAEDPYQIATAADLITLGETPADYSKHFILTADIDLDAKLLGRKVFDRAVIAPGEYKWDPGFVGTPFTGVFDGNSHTLSHLTVKGRSYVGLFGRLAPGAEVKDLHVVDVNVTGSDGRVGALAGSTGGSVTRCYSTGRVSGWCAGGLVGTNGGTVAQCYSTAAVNGGSGAGGLVGTNVGAVTQCYTTGTVSGGSSVGGLVGENSGSMTQCYSTGVVTGAEMVGGLVGYNWQGTVTQCYSTGVVSGTGSSVGGLVGVNERYVAHCYSAGAVSGKSWVGGLVGRNGNGGIGGRWASVTCCYSTGAVAGVDRVGGLVGYNVFGSVVTGCFWEIQTSRQTQSDGGAGKNTTEMQTASTFLGWGECRLWTIDQGHDYPHLAWQNMPGQAIPGPTYGGGTGGARDPYLVYTPEDLNLIGLIHCYAGRHFKLMADIDLSGFAAKNGRPAFNVIGSTFDNAFTGVFDGDGHTISNLTIVGRNYLGLFGFLSGEVKNLTIADVNIAGSGSDVGGLVGWNSGTVTQCYSTGAVRGGTHVGGLVGENDGIITQCCSTSAVSGESSVGGLVGDNITEGTVADCYGAGIVSAAGSKVGGLAGENGGLITDSYAAGAVTGSSSVGGLVGTNEYCDPSDWWGSCYPGVVSNCYSATRVTGGDSVGGLVGKKGISKVENSFWDTQTSGQAKSAGGIGKTTAEMQDIQTYLNAGWDFVGQADGPDDIWAEPIGGGYPILWWQLPDRIGSPRFSGGSGEPNDPYRISTAEDLDSIGCNPRLMQCHFKVVCDLDLTGICFYPIGYWPHPYRGVFDGNGHTISHLTIKGGGSIGLFGRMAGQVKDLGVVGVSILGSGWIVGALAGENDGQVVNCYTTGVVTGSGGAGGLVGENLGTVTQCYSTSVVSDTGSYAGGLVGLNSGTVIQCYSTGRVSGNSEVGGLVGSGHKENATDCFWDIQTSGQVTSAGGTGKTTAQMQTAKTFLDAGWDFVGETKNGTADIWWILEGKDYPRLWWEVPPAK